MAEILADIDLQTNEAQVARIRADMDDRSLGSRHIDLSKLDADRQTSPRAFFSVSVSLPRGLAMLDIDSP